MQFNAMFAKLSESTSKKAKPLGGQQLDANVPDKWSKMPAYLRRKDLPCLLCTEAKKHCTLLCPEHLDLRDRMVRVVGRMD